MLWSSDSESENEESLVVRRPRAFRHRPSYNMMKTTNEYNERFRLNATQFQQLLDVVGEHLQRPTERSQSISPELSLQIALHWLGTGAQYHAVSDMHGVSKATVCRAVHSVVESIVSSLFRQVVVWPDNMQSVIQKFFSLGGMPNVVGCIDGTLIPIDAPTSHEEQFVDRHRNHSLNCMVVCGPNLDFYYSYANWPGATHDSRVLRNSGLFQRMEAGWRPSANGIILGDSGYPLKDWLIPPIVTNLDDEGNRRFLIAHKKTRRVIENAIGILKEKFPCLNHLRCNPNFSCQVFNACVTLCNLSKQDNEENYEANVNDADIPYDNEQNIINSRFQHLQLFFQNN